MNLPSHVKHVRRPCVGVHFLCRQFKFFQDLQGGSNDRLLHSEDRLPFDFKSVSGRLRTHAQLDLLKP